MLHESETHVSLKLGIKSNALVGINGSPNSSKWIQAIELLTLQANLKPLTAITLSRIISNTGMFIPIKQWCDECYDDTRNSGEPVYDRLIWKFGSVKVCTHHQRMLRDRCPFPDCQKSISHLPRTVLAGFCPHCHRWLGKCSTELVGINDILDEAVWLKKKQVNMSIFELLQATNTYPEKFADQQIFRSLRLVLDKVFHGNLSAMGRCIGVSTATILHYRDARRRPSLPVMISLCDTLNISLVQLYSDDFDTADITYQMRLKTNPSQRIPIVDLEKALQAELDRKANNPEPIGKIAEKLGWSREYLRTHFPSLSAQLQNRWKSYQQTQLEATLLLDEPIPLDSLAKNIPYNCRDLTKLFPELCEAVVQRYRIWSDMQGAIIVKALKNALTAPEIVPIGSIAKDLNVDSSNLRRQHPELYRKVKMRFTKVARDQSLARKELEREQIRQTVLSLHMNGNPFPSKYKVFGSLPSNFDSRNPHHRQAFKDAIQELRQLPESSKARLPE